jgi:histidinol dehydrogenase
MLQNYIWQDFSEAEKSRLLKRPDTVLGPDIMQQCRQIIDAVKAEGDRAVKNLTQRFDGVVLDDFSVTEKEMADCEMKIAPALKKAIEHAYQNIRQFHVKQLPQPYDVETMPGVTCRQVFHALDRIGLYVAGGSAPLFSTMLMLGVPAQLAECPDIIVCSPPNKEGNIHPATLYAAKLCGIEKIYKIGGAQAIAVMAFGTQTIPKTRKIFGPGNSYVVASKLLVSSDPDGVAIDLPGGPSEVLIIADEDADADFIAADLLSQAEHGPDSQVILVSPSMDVIEKTGSALGRQLTALPRQEIAQKSLAESRSFLVPDMDMAIDLSNSYAPEHLILNVIEADKHLPKIRNAGSVFVGAYTPESAGDYASGTNHVLPTQGFARNYGGISVSSYMRSMTIQEITDKGLMTIGPIVETMAEAEGLQAHANAVNLRRAKIMQASSKEA